MLPEKHIPFTASLDNQAKGVTIAVTILFAIIIFGPFFFYYDEEIVLSLSVGIGLLAIYFLAYGYSPREYFLTKDKLIVRRLFKNIQIDKEDIKSVERIEKEKLTGSFRSFAVGGLFGYFGKFENTKLGEMTWYVTRLDKAILITTIDNKKILISPDNVDGFVADFN